MKKQLFAASALMAVLAACNPSTNEGSAPSKIELAAKPAELGAWGIDLAQKMEEVKPGDDFFRHVNGKWLDTFEIPADKTNYGSFTVLGDRSEAQVRAIIQDSAKAGAATGTAKQKVGDMYASFMDTESIEAKGLDPLRSDLDAIMAAKSHDDIVRIMARPDLPSNAPFGGFVNIDSKSTENYAFYMLHAGLGLPNREYYLEDNERFSGLRAGYLKHMENMLNLAEVPDAEARAAAIMALEYKIAEAHWDKVDRRNRDLTYNKMTMAELEAFAPGYPWAVANSASGLNVSEVVVREKSAFPKIAQIFADTSLDDWKSYLTFHVLSANAASLPAVFDNENFDFYGKQLGGQPEQRERWKRAVGLVNGSLGEAVGQVYVERHFPPIAKKQMDELVENLRVALGQRIDGLEWMGADTKVEAHKKLAAFTPKIGYPDKWKDYSSMTIRADDLMGNTKAAGVWGWNDQISKLGGPIDRTEWFMNPQTVNAYYSPTRNEIVFPAAILQAPFFDPNADAAVNYGAIGAVIGHEMGHGFDDQGSKSDGTGKLRNWWSESDKQQFEARAAELGKQYDQYSPVEGHHVNGKFTMGENIGDLGGLTFALAAYRLSLGGKEAPVLGGYTGDQRVFLSWAQVWRRKYREENLINRLTGDPHAPSEYRTNGVVRNMDEWYEAFGITEGDAMYLAPEKRVRIW